VLRHLPRDESDGSKLIRLTSSFGSRTLRHALVKTSSGDFVHGRIGNASQEQDQLTVDEFRRQALRNNLVSRNAHQRFRMVSEKVFLSDDSPKKIVVPGQAYMSNHNSSLPDAVYLTVASSDRLGGMTMDPKLARDPVEVEIRTQTTVITRDDFPLLYVDRQAPEGSHTTEQKRYKTSSAHKLSSDILKERLHFLADCTVATGRLRSASQSGIKSHVEKTLDLKQMAVGLPPGTFTEASVLRFLNGEKVTGYFSGGSSISMDFISEGVVSVRMIISGVELDVILAIRVPHTRLKGKILRMADLIRVKPPKLYPVAEVVKIVTVRSINNPEFVSIHTGKNQFYPKGDHFMVSSHKEFDWVKESLDEAIRNTSQWTNFMKLFRNKRVFGMDEEIDFEVPYPGSQATKTLQTTTEDYNILKYGLEVADTQLRDDKGPGVDVGARTDALDLFKIYVLHLANRIKSNSGDRLASESGSKVSTGIESLLADGTGDRLMTRMTEYLDSNGGVAIGPMNDLHVHEHCSYGITPPGNGSRKMSSGAFGSRRDGKVRNYYDVITDYARLTKHRVTDEKGKIPGIVMISTEDIMVRIILSTLCVTMYYTDTGPFSTTILSRSRRSAYTMPPCITGLGLLYWSLPSNLITINSAIPRIGLSKRETPGIRGTMFRFGQGERNIPNYVDSSAGGGETRKVVMASFDNTDPVLVAHNFATLISIETRDDCTGRTHTIILPNGKEICADIQIAQLVRAMAAGSQPLDCVFWCPFYSITVHMDPGRRRALACIVSSPRPSRVMPVMRDEGGLNSSHLATLSGQSMGRDIRVPIAATMRGSGFMEPFMAWALAESKRKTSAAAAADD